MSPISPLSISPATALPPSLAHGISGSGGSSPAFAGMLDAAKQAVGEVARMQTDATRAAESLALGETDDVVGVMATVEKGELAFKTLLAIRTKLMSALDEVRNMPV